MNRLKTLIATFQNFRSNPQQRRTVMWVIGAFSAAVILFGGYQIVAGHLEYGKLSDDLDDVRAQIDIFVGQYPEVERDGKMTHDLTEATDTDKQYLALLHSRERNVFNDRVNAENQRSGGIRLAGIGVIGLALAYLILPENKDQPEPDIADAPPAPQNE